MEPTFSPIVYNVGTESEFRFSVGEELPVHLELTGGCAEIFGYELLLNKVYTFPPHTSASVFSWRGCQLKLWGVTENACLSTNSLVKMQVNLHSSLEEMRRLAHSRQERGPVCLVVGPVQSGKTSFCKLLLNYATRQGWRPLFVDMNVTHNTLSLPGVFSVLPVESSLDIAGGLNPRGLSVFSYGSDRPRQNIPLYYLMIRRLGEMLVARLEGERPRTRSSGVVVDTSSWFKRRGYAALTLAAFAFRVDVVFVVRSRVLFSRFRADMPSGVRVVYVPRPDGVVRRKNKLRADIRANRVWEYFYGPSGTPLRPHQFEVRFADVEIYRSQPPKKSELVGIDPRRVGVGDVRVKRVGFTQGLVNRVLGISFADSVDENLIVTNVKGFVCVLKVDRRRKVLTVLSPQPAPLPNRILVLSLVKLKRFCKKPPPVRRPVDYSMDT